MRIINNYFPENYYCARDFFKRNLDNDEHISKKVIEDITFDAIIHKSSTKKRVLLVVSAGVHGVEAKAGVAMISKIIKDYKHKFRKDVGLLVMPYVNPYGFAHGRRFNENNVDLNRNCLDNSGRPKDVDKKFLEFQKRLFARFCQKKRYNAFQFLRFIFNLIYTKSRYGYKLFKNAIAGGQDFDKEAIFFVGNKLEKSIKIAKDIIADLSEGYKTVIIWDMHFGLGEFKELSIFTNENYKSDAYKILKNMFPKKTISPNMEYESKGSFSDYLVKYSRASKTLNFETEIGTYGIIKTLFALIKENQIFHYNKNNRRKKEKVKQEMFEIFCPKDFKWRQNILNLTDDIMQGLDRRFALLKN